MDDVTVGSDRGSIQEVIQGIKIDIVFNVMASVMERVSR